MGGGRGCHSKTSAARDKRRHWPCSELPPNNPFTLFPRSIWYKNYHNAPAITKSRLPTTARCSNDAYQRSQILHVVTDAATNPTAAMDRGRRPSQFLGDSAVDVPAMHASKNESYWCVLRVDSTPEIVRTPPPSPSPAIAYYRFDNLEPRMAFAEFVGPSTPTSGLVVNYAVSGPTGRYTSSKCVSIRHECATVDPFDPKKKSIEFTAGTIRLQEKFFAMSLQGTLVVMQMSDYRLTITGMSAIRAIPSSDWKFFKQYLIEMNGEILLVFLIYEKPLTVVDRVEVFRLNFIKLGWIRVERLGGKTMFLKEKCIWVDSAEVGCRDNCVYFYHKSDDSWKVYDMTNGGISIV